MNNQIMKSIYSKLTGALVIISLSFASFSCGNKGDGESNGSEDTTTNSSMQKQKGSDTGKQSMSPEQRKKMKQKLQQMRGNKGGQSADIDVSDEELKKFATISQKIRQKQQKARQKMQGVVQESDLSKKRYREIAQSQQKSRRPGGGQQKQGGSDVSDKEQKEFDEVNKKIRPIRQGVRKNAMQTIKENDMEVQRFQKIAKAVRKDPKLQKRLQEYRSQNGSAKGNMSQGGAN